MLTDTRKSPYAKAVPLSWDAVEWRDGFWKEAVSLLGENTVPHLQAMFEAKDISHVVENFRICAGDSEGEHDGTVFGDGDFYKWMEAALYTAAHTGDEALLEKLEEYVDLFRRAQQEDGYLSTKQIIGEMHHTGANRMGDINDFEVYNFGHLFTSACLYKRVTGKDSFLEVAKRAADYLEQLYEEAARTGEVKTAVCPSHYMGLIEMYRTTGNERYLRLAETAVRLRDSVKNGLDDNQDRIPLKEHEKIVGHAVRSNYLYAGVADLYAEEGDQEYLDVLHKVWRNLADQKLYITGGCGALYNGTSPYGNFFIDQKVHQAYGYEYQLPNVTAYNETCASLGLVFWAYRMFLIEPSAEYFDIIERAMLNVNLAAVSFDGKKYFYENMLRRAKKLPYDLVWPLERSEYILSYCCPPNLARTIAQAGEYLYTVSKDTVWLGMYGASKARIRLENGAEFTLVQDTKYPWDGTIRITFEDIKADLPFKLNVRIPAWSQKSMIIVNGREEIHKESGRYVTVSLNRAEGAEVVVKLDMEVRYTIAHGLVEENTCQAAIERGPLVYCMETPDVDIDTLDDIFCNLKAEFKQAPFTIADREVMALEGSSYRIVRGDFERNALYQRLSYQGMEEIPVRLIPYYAWDNRGYGEMRIWLPIAYC